MKVVKAVLSCIHLIQYVLYGVGVKKSFSSIAVSVGLILAVFSGDSSLGQRHLEYTERQNIITKFESLRS
jgi:hypothetical protein